MATFRSKRSFTEGDTTVEVGTKSSKPAIKVTLPAGSAFIVDPDTADDLAAVIDDALDAFETDPLLWENGSR